MTMQSSNATPRKALALAARVLTLAMCVTAIAVAAEKKIPRSALPPAVEKTVQSVSQGAPSRTSRWRPKRARWSMRSK